MATVTIMVVVVPFDFRLYLFTKKKTGYIATKYTHFHPGNKIKMSS